MTPIELDEIKRRTPHGYGFTKVWSYPNAAGEVIGFVARYDAINGAKPKKMFLPFRFENSTLINRKVSSIYRLDLLAKNPDAPVLILEGEKTADAAAAMFAHHICITTAGGANGAKDCDLSALEGRDITIIPDTNEPGLKYAHGLAKRLPQAKVVVFPEGFLSNWDVADRLPDGFTEADLTSLIAEARAPEMAPVDGAAKMAEATLKAVLSPNEVAKRKAASELADKYVTKDGKPPTKKELKEEAKKEAKRKAVELEESRECIKATVAAALVEKGEAVDGDELLDRVRTYLRRFVSYPSGHASVAHALWIAHTHMMDIWDSTPRLAFMSPERGSGKTRALEAMEFLVPRPIHSVNNSVAFVIRKVASDEGKPTILYDEVDALFGNKAPDKADLLALLNAGHRKGATSGRCIVDGGKVRLEELPAYAALALAGLRDLPDTLASRSILIEMRRRAPDETVEPFRERIHKPQALPIYGDLAAWCANTAQKFAGKYPEVPAEITDRDADCWEPLLAIADAAGGNWPEIAREAAVYLVRRGRELIPTKGVELLEHVREAFGAADSIWTKKLLEALFNRDESPWQDARGNPLTDRGLANLLRPYGIKSRDIRIGEQAFKGYLAADFVDAWNRYLKPSPASRDKRDKRDIFDNKNNFVADVADVADREGEKAPPCQACDGNYGRGCPHCVPQDYGLPPKKKAAQ